MRIQSISQNNYQNTRSKSNIGFKESFCIKLPQVNCPRNTSCGRFQTAAQEKVLTAATRIATSFQDEIGGLLPFLEEEPATILVLDMPTLQRMENAIAPGAESAILADLKAGRGAEIIEVNTQEICAGIPCDYKRGQ